MPPRGNKTNRGGGGGIKGRPGRPPKKIPKQGGGVEVALTTPLPFLLQFKIRKPRTKTRRAEVIKAKTQNTSYSNNTTMHALTISDESGEVVPSISPPPHSYLDNGEESSTATSTTTVTAASGRGYAAAAAAEIEEGTVTAWDIDLPMLSQIVIPGPIPDLGSLYWEDSVFANFFNDIP